MATNTMPRPVVARCECGAIYRDEKVQRCAESPRSEQWVADLRRGGMGSGGLGRSRR